MSKIEEAINSLSSEELDLLNSDTQMLNDFKNKYSEPEVSKIPAVQSPGLVEQASQYVQKQGSPMRTVPEMAVGMTNFVNPTPFMPTLKNPVPNIPAEFEKKRQFLEGVGTQVKGASESSVGNIVEDVSRLATKYLPKNLANGISTLAGFAGGAVNTATTLAPFKPSEFAAETAGAILPVVVSDKRFMAFSCSTSDILKACLLRLESLF